MEEPNPNLLEEPDPHTVLPKTQVFYLQAAVADDPQYTTEFGSECQALLTSYNQKLEKRLHGQAGIFYKLLEHDVDAIEAELLKDIFLPKLKLGEHSLNEEDDTEEDAFGESPEKDAQKLALEEAIDRCSEEAEKSLFGQFLISKEIYEPVTGEYEGGSLDFARYINEHDSLQQEYYDLMGSYATQVEAREDFARFDKICKLHMLLTKGQGALVIFAQLCEEPYKLSGSLTASNVEQMRTQLPKGESEESEYEQKIGQTTTQFWSQIHAKLRAGRVHIAKFVEDEQAAFEQGLRHIYQEKLGDDASLSAICYQSAEDQFTLAASPYMAFLDNKYHFFDDDGYAHLKEIGPFKDLLDEEFIAEAKDPELAQEQIDQFDRVMAYRLLDRAFSVTHAFLHELVLDQSANRGR